MTTPLPGERVSWIDRDAVTLQGFFRFGRVRSLRRHGGYWFALVEREPDKRLAVVALGLLQRVEEEVQP